MITQSYNQLSSRQLVHKTDNIVSLKIKNITPEVMNIF